MFYRYAHHVRSGLGMSWNLDGLHTYGETSLTWAWVILALSFLPLGMAHLLVGASWLFAGVAIATLAVAITRLSRSAPFRELSLVLPMTALPLLTMRIFLRTAIIWIEKILALALCAAFLALLLGVGEGRASVWVLALSGLALYLTRPEAGLTVVLALGCAAIVLPERRRLFFVAFGLFLAGVAVSMAACRWYFGTALPLSFYMKSQHAYTGYAMRWYPVHSAALFLSQAGLFLVVLAALARREDWRLLVLALVPLGGTITYLWTLTQIMGFGDRYYVPYLPLLILPTSLVVDGRLREAKEVTRPAHAAMPRLAVLAAVVYLVQAGYPDTLLLRLDGLAEDRVQFDPPVMVTAAGSPLPYVEWRHFIEVMGSFAAGLPKGSTMAASEVGYLGAMAPEVNIIDLAGLNDTGIALHGFQPGRFLDRHPDLIWMPHTDYTYQRGVLFTDPSLLANYDVYDGAAEYGIAVRKDSPYRAGVQASVEQLFHALYPDEDPRMHLVKSVRWDRTSHPTPVLPQSAD